MRRGDTSARRARARLMASLARRRRSRSLTMAVNLPLAVNSLLFRSSSRSSSSSTLIAIGASYLFRARYSLIMPINHILIQQLQQLHVLCFPLPAHPSPHNRHAPFPLHRPTSPAPLTTAIPPILTPPVPAHVATTAAMPLSTARPRLTVAHRSTSQCVVCSAFTSTSSVQAAVFASAALRSRRCVNGSRRRREYGIVASRRSEAERCAHGDWARVCSSDAG